MKIPLIVLLSVLVMALAISLTTVYRMDGRVSHMRSMMGECSDQAQLILNQRDTLALINAAFSAREDSLPYLRHTADSLQVRLDEVELVNNYLGYYLIIDTGQNRFHLRRGGLLVRSGYCGTGKGWTENDSGMVWNFSTPRGIRYVVKKGENPYWYKPDWYWLEQDLRPPRPGQDVLIPDSLSWEEQIVYYNDSLTSSERVWVRAVPGALGNFKLDLGGGILLHYGVGRGRNVSHGCIRLGNSDLAAIYRALPVGAPVLIY
ncbi:MAG: L,D-transpeptidase [Candidatus Sabulitectum sp.]|nr:L,D-transpeptidase [Candidatus Sabulitectum sp.]